MATVVTVQPKAEPVHLDEAKKHLRLESSFTDDDAYVTSLIVAARAYAEQYTNRKFVDQTIKTTFEEFDSELRLPAPPTVSVSGITYVDSNGTRQTLATSVYASDTLAEPAVVRLAYNQTWPIYREEANCVQVTHVNGYASVFTASAATDIITAYGRTYTLNDVIRFTNSGGALPAGLSTATDYYVLAVTNNTFQVSTSQGGAAVDITGTGTGTHFIGEIPQGIKHAMLLLIGHWYEHREGVVDAGSLSEAPAAVDALLWMNRIAEVS